MSKYTMEELIEIRAAASLLQRHDTRSSNMIADMIWAETDSECWCPEIGECDPECPKCYGTKEDAAENCELPRGVSP